MRILVIGSGGREHALVWKLSRSNHAKQMWCAPGNAGIASERLASNNSAVQCVPLSADNLPELIQFAREQRIDLTVVGPDNPLALGIVDRFQENGLRIWGPTQSAARFESSKAFAQEFMARHGIPTARAGTFQDPASAIAFARSLLGKCAVKADGLALGKGVLLCNEMGEAVDAIEEILVRRTFGNAGSRVVIQELLEGVEVSLHALCDGKHAKLFPTSQDHKRALDDDQGANTGGMGAISPTPFLTNAELESVGQQVLQPWLRGCEKEAIDFRGILYPGIMLTSAGPRVLEFNARFGDPEAQVYLTRLETDLVELLEASVDGNLAGMTLKWVHGASVCVVLASGGYPGVFEKGKVIRGLSDVATLPNVKVFHAGTVGQGSDVLTAGGRVLGITAWGADLHSAREIAYAAADQIQFEGKQLRLDIGAKALRHSDSRLLTSVPGASSARQTLLAKP